MFIKLREWLSGKKRIVKPNEYDLGQLKVEFIDRSGNIIDRMTFVGDWQVSYSGINGGIFYVPSYARAQLGDYLKECKNRGIIKHHEDGYVAFDHLDKVNIVEKKECKCVNPKYPYTVTWEKVI